MPLQKYKQDFLKIYIFQIVIEWLFHGKQNLYKKTKLLRKEVHVIFIL